MLPLRLIIILMLFAVSFLPGTAAKAQQLHFGEDKKEAAEIQADNFYKSCIKNPVINLSKTTDQAFCACSSSELLQWLLEPEQRTGNEFLGSGKKELDEQTLITKVYAGCLYIPIWELTYMECRADDKHAAFVKSEEEFEMLCHCIATDVEDYYEEYAKPYLEMKAAKGETIEDPISEVKRSTSYYDATSSLVRRCYDNIKQLDRARRR